MPSISNAASIQRHPGIGMSPRLLNLPQSLPWAKSLEAEVRRTFIILGRIHGNAYA